MHRIGEGDDIEDARFAAERGDLRLLNAPLPSSEAIAVTPSIRELPFVEYDPGYRAEEWIWRPLDHSYSSLRRFEVSWISWSRAARPIRRCSS